MKELDVKSLIEKYNNGTLSEKEKAMLESWYIHEISINKDFHGLEENLSKLDDRMVQLLYTPIKRRLWPKYAGIAAMLTLFAFGIWFFALRLPGSNHRQAVAVQNDVAPGKNTATLSLSDGEVMQLSEAHSGVIIGQDKLTYNDGSKVGVSATGSISRMMTAATPRGGTYQFILPDGSKVWLNAASSIKFPSTFSGAKTRNIELVGEAYFEISKNKSQPFIVNSKNQMVTVLGTHFNISSYTDEVRSKTTLLEGSIKINNTMLVPGQQATVNGTKIIVDNVNVEKAAAWKDNRFVFENDNITAVMQVLQRWYDVQVVYEGKLPKDSFGGIISRNEPLSEVLKYLELTSNVRFKIEGRRIRVIK
ncbi:FecR protein [Pedobacter steynii]|uniref:FecR protein n=1 Tax=Pedobacter steynii TaxID=430522 RepID=A0A1G9NUK1_9SPHI|nr:FecR family protein [Pedobacter steynii]NQX39182.1 FecR family protein [Pedobacter steynii]SDL90266.1 FecR protein [Pedobacter steynii]